MPGTVPGVAAALPQHRFRTSRQPRRPPEGTEQAQLALPAANTVTRPIPATACGNDAAGAAGRNPSPRARARWAISEGSPPLPLPGRAGVPGARSRVLGHRPSGATVAAASLTGPGKVTPAPLSAPRGSGPCWRAPAVEARGPGAERISPQTPGPSSGRRKHQRPRLYRPTVCQPPDTSLRPCRAPAAAGSPQRFRGPS